MPQHGHAQTVVTLELPEGFRERARRWTVDGIPRFGPVHASLGQEGD